MKQRTIYSIMTAGGAIGLAASFIQMLEKIQLLKDAGKVLSCDINGIFSCSTVLSAWQSSVFGFPNSLLCIIFFTIFASMGIAGLSGATLPKGLRLGMHTLAVGVLFFGLWFLLQSVFAIQALCILCLFCFSGLLFVNWAWLRINAKDLPLRQQERTALATAIERGYDTVFWILVAVALALVMIAKFGL